jgi:hypothetical protein
VDTWKACSGVVGKKVGFLPASSSASGHHVKSSITIESRRKRMQSLSTRCESGTFLFIF